MNKTFFHAISPEGTLPVQIVVPLRWEDGKTDYVSLEVVGVSEDTVDCQLGFDEHGNYTGQVEIYLSLTTAFSLLFAYKSTKVEIVQYLKAE